MDGREFLKGLIAGTRAQLPDALTDARTETGHSIGKLWYGNSDLHYECWLRARLGTLELGLHFESDALTNARLLAAFRARKRAVRRALGTAARLEEWDRGWARVWESQPLGTLDNARQRDVAARLARYVTALEPILRDELPADVRWTQPAARKTRA